jgi:hypothetical protein
MVLTNQAAAPREPNNAWQQTESANLLGIMKPLNRTSGFEYVIVSSAS